MRKTNGVSDRLKRTFLIALLILVASCSGSSDEDADGDSPDGDTPSDGDGYEGPIMHLSTIHVYSDWTPYLYASQDLGEHFATYPGERMVTEYDGWWVTYEVDRGPTGQLTFLFNNGAPEENAANWIRPYGQEDCATCYFATSEDEVWVLDGRVYAQKPEDPIDGDSDAPDGDAETDADGDVDAPDGDAETDADGDVEIDEDTPSLSYTVNFWSGWSQPYIHYSLDGNTGSPSQWTSLPGQAMTPVRAGWWRAAVAVPAPYDLVFLFNDGADDWHKPFGCTGEACHFQTAASTVWVRNGFLYTSEPAYKTYTVHFLSGWTQSYMHYSFDGNTGNPSLWTTPPGTAMNAEGDSRWGLQVDIEATYDLVFLFTDGADGWHHPEGCGDCNFQTALSEFWVQDGQILEQAP